MTFFSSFRSASSPLRPTAADHAKILGELLGLPVKADKSVVDRERADVLYENGAFSCAFGAAPVFEGDGITLYSWAEARRIWGKRLKRQEPGSGRVLSVARHRRAAACYASLPRCAAPAAQQASIC